MSNPAQNSFGLNSSNPHRVPHDSSHSQMKGVGNSSGDSRRKFNMNTPSFQPLMLNLTGKFAGLLPKLKDIPTFVPSGFEPPGYTGTGDASPSLASRKFNAATPSFTPANPYESFNPGSANTDYSLDGYTSQDSAATPVTDPMLISQMGQSNTPKLQQNPYLSDPNTPGGPPITHPSNVSSVFMYHNQSAPNYPLNYHLYSPAPPPRLSMSLSPHETNVNAMFIPNDLRETITRRNEAALRTLGHSSLPDHVGDYHLLVPIDNTFSPASKVYGLPTAVYKVNSNVNGLTYAMRKVDLAAQPILNEQAFLTVKKWKRLNNPNVVRVKDAFTSVAFDIQQPVLCVVYDYYPLSSTLEEHVITRKLGVKLEQVSEQLLWNYLIQLVGAIISIHREGLFAGQTLSSSKVIVTNKNRIRLAAACMEDILNHEAIDRGLRSNGKTKTLLDLQTADFVRLGNLMTELTVTTLPNLLRSEFNENLVTRLKSSASKSFTEEWIEVLRILNNPDDQFNLSEFYAQLLSLKSLEIINGLQDLTDYFEGHLLSEVENGRLFRLLSKLTSVIDQPESDADVVGNISVLKLFRDFVFHARDESGKPALDLSRVLVNLNKLDVGVDEKLLLVSSQEDTCVIVSYKEVKDILEQTFRAVYRS